MLKIFFGKPKEMKLSGDGWFENDPAFDDNNLNSDFCKRVVKEIDKSELISQNVVLSPYLGSISTKEISGGAKTLILMMYTDFIFRLSAIGDNCYKFLPEICEKKDLIVCSNYFKNIIGLSGLKEIKVLNSGKIVKTDIELMDEFFKIEESGELEYMHHTGQYMPVPEG